MQPKIAECSPAQLKAYNRKLRQLMLRRLGQGAHTELTIRLWMHAAKDELPTIPVKPRQEHITEKTKELLTQRKKKSGTQV